MRFAFAGTAPFAELVLDGLVAARAARRSRSSPIPTGRAAATARRSRRPSSCLAEALGVPVLQPERLSDARGGRSELLALGPTCFVVCAYGADRRRRACSTPCETIVVHPSLVPHWRGAAPVERALMAGETELGVCTLRMTAGVDEGPVGDARLVHVPRDADAGRAYELLAPAAVDGVVATLDAMAAGTVAVAPAGGRGHLRGQDRAGRQGDRLEPARRGRSPTRCALSRRTSARSRSSPAGARASGAPRPATGPMPETGPGALVIAAGEGWLDVLELQQEGRNRMTAGEFLRGAGRSLLAP